MLVSEKTWTKPSSYELDTKSRITSYQKFVETVSFHES